MSTLPFMLFNLQKYTNNFFAEICEPLMVTDGGVVSCTAQPYWVGTTCYVACNEGCIIDANDFSCQAGGMWSDDAICMGEKEMVLCYYGYVIY